MFNIPSGQCMGIILPYGLEYLINKNESFAEKLFQAVANLDDRAKTSKSAYKQKIIDDIKQIQSEMANLKKNAIPKTLAQTDISKNSLPAIAQKAIDNGLSMDKDECIKVLTAAYEGKSLA